MDPQDRSGRDFTIGVYPMLPDETCHQLLRGFPETPGAAAPLSRRLGIIGGVAPLMGYTALSLGLAGYVSALFKLSTVLTPVWAFFILGERGVARRLPGAVMMLVGGLLIAS